MRVASGPRDCKALGRQTLRVSGFTAVGAQARPKTRSPALTGLPCWLPCRPLACEAERPVRVIFDILGGLERSV